MSGSIIFIRANMFMSDSIMNSYSGGFGSSGGSCSSDSSFHMPGLNRDLKQNLLFPIQLDPYDLYETCLKVQTI